MKYKVRLLEQNKLEEASLEQITRIIKNMDSMTQETLDSYGPTVIKDKENKSLYFKTPVELFSSLISNGYTPVSEKTPNGKANTPLGQKIANIMKSKALNFNQALEHYINSSPKLKMILDHYVRDTLPSADVEKAVDKRSPEDRKWGFKDITKEIKR